LVVTLEMLVAWLVEWEYDPPLASEREHRDIPVQRTA
jgi:hypothetical protein